MRIEDWEPGEFDRARTVRVVRTGGCLFLFVLVAIVLLAVLRPFTDYQWYLHDVRQPQVFLRTYSARGLLFAFAFFPAWALLALSLRKALSLSLIYLRRPETMPEVLVSNLLGWLQKRGAAVLRLAAPVVAFLFALAFAKEWMTFLQATHAVSFGQKDPSFGLDLSFFVFVLPWYRAIANAVFLLFLLTTALSVGVYIGLQSLAALAKIELAQPGVRLHLSLLIAGTMLSGATHLWLKTYEVGLVASEQFTGAGYAASLGVGATRLVAGLLVLVAVATLANARRGEAYRAPIAGGIVVGLAYLIGALLIPTIIQRAYVSPQLTNVEAKFAERAIRMTRFGYNLDKIESRAFQTAPVPSAQQISQSRATLDNMRLWDPEVMRLSFDSFQALRRYYSFDDVDIDRYTIDGKPTMVMLAPREIDPSGLDISAQNWNNRKLRYTHGYGIAMAQVNDTSPDGRPRFLVQDIPVEHPPQIPIRQPRIYFGDRRDASGRAIDEYALVNTEVPELDYQTASGFVTHRWTGGRGIPIGSFFARLAFSVVLMDGNLLVAPNLTSSTRLLMRRNILERAHSTYPFLAFDSDPYLVVYQGRLIWMLDGYTISSNIPYSAMVQEGNGRLNYIRNSVKATVDAYTGEIRAYAVEPNEPILRSFRSIYPGLILDRSELPEGLDAHFRYPEDLLNLQSFQLQAYHVQDPTVFLSNGDAWEIANQRGVTGGREPMRPYYVLMQLPDEPKAGFLQILPFTPRGKQNMSGWLAAHCDPGDYGRLTLYRFQEGSPPPGPELMESLFNSNSDISYINRTFTNDQSEVIFGNLLVVPIGDSVMYVEPLFLSSRSGSSQTSPPLFRVVLAFENKIVVRNTYAEALRALFGSNPQPSVTPSGPSTQPQNSPDAQKALELFRQSDEALREGDFSRFGELRKELRETLERLAR